MSDTVPVEKLRELSLAWRRKSDLPTGWESEPTTRKVEMLAMRLAYVRCANELAALAALFGPKDV